MNSPYACYIITCRETVDVQYRLLVPGSTELTDEAVKRIPETFDALLTLGSLTRLAHTANMREREIADVRFTGIQR